MAKKIFFLLEPHPAYLRVWMTVSPLILRSESATDFNCTDFLSLMIMNSAYVIIDPLSSQA